MKRFRVFRAPSICLIIDRKTASWDTAKDWDNDKVADWYECVKIFAKHGWDWGGNWKTFKDLPHFEKEFLDQKRVGKNKLENACKAEKGCRRICDFLKFFIRRVLAL
ncbi:M15 family metallopeptidase [Chryseobacterium indoltheticum]|uniref:M15 family metallopeptidase n=1 Tax=Chryseobacterium indoltheticum TaxID=254 RepID=UPI003F49A86C